MKRVGLTMCLLALALLGGCSSYLDDFQYTPRPAMAEIRSNSRPQTPALVAFASVIGVHREDSKLEIPESVEIRLRLENNGPEAATFDPHSMELTTAQLVAFPPPLVRAPSPITLNATEGATLTAFFPLPARFDGNDLESFTLRWNIQIGNQNMSQNVSFRRVYPQVYYYDPYWRPYPGYPPYFWYGGVVVVHRR